MGFLPVLFSFLAIPYPIVLDIVSMEQITPKIQWLKTAIPWVRNLDRAQMTRFISCLQCLSLSWENSNTGGDVTPRGWNHLKVIYLHVWCMGCDDSKTRTADQSTHTWFDMWYDFLSTTASQRSARLHGGSAFRM